jgi:hypothetical protein
MCTKLYENIPPWASIVQILLLQIDHGLTRNSIYCQLYLN